MKREPSNFLVRPLSKERLMYGVRRAIRELEEEDEDCFAVAGKGSGIQDLCREIFCILKARKEF